MQILKKQPPTAVIDKHFTVKCPHCTVPSGLSAISLPNYDLLERYQPPRVGIGYQCDACSQPVFLRFRVSYRLASNLIDIDEGYEEVERPQEQYEFKHLPSTVANDFREALACYSISCFNAFAAMCRRTIQSAASSLGAEGSDRVSRQVDDLKSTADVDQETFDVLKAIVIAGHDGAHPHLPALSADRAEILLELMKDVLYQLFVRRVKLEEAAAKRNAAIAAKKAQPKQLG
jgi:Domain of unknown function (DUF4145)